MSSCLVSLRDHKGRYLRSDNTDNLVFTEEGDAFRLARLGANTVCLQHEHGTWLTLEAEQLSLGSQPVPLELYVNLEKLVAFKLPTGDFLSSKRECGSLAGAPGPLRIERSTKLFSVDEVAMPRHAIASWPLRCSLSTVDGVYISNSGGKAAANVEVPCCSEEFILDAPTSCIATKHGTAICNSSLWVGDGCHLASVEHHTGQILFRPQHSCLGHENFLVTISPSNQVRLVQGPPNSRLTAAVTCQWPNAMCKVGGKPTSLHLELVSTKPSLIVTAHGTLLGARSLPMGRASETLCCLSRPESSDLRAATWLLEDHGECIYTIRSADSGRYIYLGNHGVLTMSGSNEIEYPDPRTLFTVEMAWTDPVGIVDGICCALDGADGFIAPKQDQRAFGFVIKTVAKVDRQQLCLCALPDGRITTTYSKRPLSRWELFTITDKEILLNSSLRPLDRLENQPVASLRTIALRRSISCQTIESSCRNSLPSSSQSVSSSALVPSSGLPGILEAEEELLISVKSGLPGAVKTGEVLSIRGNRRCMSESALTDLVHQQPTSKALAALCNPSAKKSGWGVRSAATIEEASLQSLCITVYQECRKELPLVTSPSNFLRAAEEVLQNKLPDEIRRQLILKLGMLMRRPEQTKICYKQLHKAALHGTLHSWAESLVFTTADEDIALPEELAESWVCSTCKGFTGLLLPLDPEINPRHFRFLAAMERRHFGGNRRRRGARRLPDAIAAGLHLVKHGFLVFGIARCLGTLMKNGKKTMKLS